MIRHRTSITLRGNDAFVVRYADTDPERAKRMAERLASMFIEETSGARARQVQGANEFIDNQLVSTKKELEEVEGQLKRIKQRYMGMLPNQLEANLSTLQRIELERQSVTDQLRAAKERRSLLERQLSLQAQMNEPEAQLIPDLPANPGPAAGPPTGSSLPLLKAYLEQLLTRYTAEHPEVVATRKRIARLEKEAAEAAAAEPPPAGNPEPPAEGPAEVAQNGTTSPTSPATSTEFLVSDMTAQIGAVDRDIEKLQSRYEEIQKQIATYQTRVEKIPEVEQELQSLERDYDLINKYYSELLSRKLEAETAGAVERRWQEEQFKILDPAQAPEKADFPKASVFLLVGTLLGVGAGLLAAFLVEVTDPTVKNQRELENLLPYPVLLSLPRLKERRVSFRPRGRSPLPPPAPPGTSVESESEFSAAS
jgi:polysaccharide chain length determinant protein (PEP-CTERM system associated)